MQELYRPTEDRIIGGVCAGLAQYFNMEATWLRLGFVVLMLINGLGGLIYLVAWIIIPDEEHVGQPSEEIVRANIAEMQARLQSLTQNMGGSTLIGIILIGLGALLLTRSVLPGITFPVWPLLLIGLGLYLITTYLRSS